MSKAPAARKHAKKGTRSDVRRPNLLITIQERHRKLAKKEVGALLERIGINDYRFVAVDEGILGLRLKTDDPKSCVERLQPLLREDPLAFQHTHRWIPVEAWLNTQRADLERFGDTAQAAIGPSDSWKIDLHRHHSSLDRDLMITSLAKGIDNPHVDLRDADKTVALELVGNKAAVSVLAPSQKLSVDHVLKHEFVRFEEVE